VSLTFLFLRVLQKEKSSAVGPVMLGFFLFVVVGSGGLHRRAGVLFVEEQQQLLPLAGHSYVAKSAHTAEGQDPC
jgi:hypothetical protein